LLIPQKTTSFYLKPIAIAEVLTHIKLLNPAKSTGPEGIPLKFIVMMAEIITPVLVNLHNKGYTTLWRDHLGTFWHCPYGPF